MSIGNIISGVLASSIVLNSFCLQDLNAASGFTSAKDPGLTTNRTPDETFRLFDTYEAGIESKELRARLHSVALFLQKNPDFNGFIVSYAGQRACAGEAIQRAKIVRQLLAGKEGVKSKQLKIIDAGYRSNWAIELWFTPMRAKGQPLSRSTIDRSLVKITTRCTDIISLR